MGFLYMMESIRTPFGAQAAALMTRLGEETFFMLAGMVLLWCLDKKWGFRLLLTGMAGTTLNQLLKGIFLIPRPWVLDPQFTIVESARAAATGYSFPSGHTQSAAVVLGTVAVWQKKTWVTIVCAVMTLLVGFSRMYLGVHTPLDVGVSLVTGVLTVALFAWLFEKLENNRRGKVILGLAVLAFSAALVCFVTWMPAGERNIAEFDGHGVKSAWTILGGTAGLLAAWWLDDRYVHFDTKAVWWAQILKALGGAAMVMAVRLGLKPVLNAALGDAPVSSAIRYFLMALLAGGVWPMTFGFFGRLGKKKA